MTTALALPQRRVERCMGTVFSIDVRAPGVDPSVIDDVVRWLHWVDATFSPYRADSAISRLDRGELKLADCDREVREVLERCAEVEVATGGFFTARPAGRLDPSGFVKGWAIERAGDLLSAAGSRNHCVNGGGDVQCAGHARADEPWRIGIVDPTDSSRVLATVRGTELAVATSGTAERGNHILDPHTSRPSRGLLSVSVIGARLSVVDAYATAAFAMGAQCRDWLAEVPGIDALVVFADGRTWSPR
jgi:thiamine biosynthesis lipoprotein